MAAERASPSFNVRKIKPNAARVWRPGRGGRGGSEGRGGDDPTPLDRRSPPSFGDVPQVWTPRAGSASPSLGRKEYRKVAYEGRLSRPPSQENVSAPRPEESFAWRDTSAPRPDAPRPSPLPPSQSPTVTLLKGRRDGQIPSRRPEYMSGDEMYRPGEKLYTIKREYESEDEEPRRFAVLGPRKVEGVGPTTREGVPMSLKTGIKSEHQGEWYRRMFDSLHKVKDVRYTSGGYASEPGGYESDYCLSSRYSTLDRGDWDPTDSLRRNVKRYVHQPGRIENYVPGCSSLSERELRANPEIEYKIESKEELSRPAQRTAPRTQMTHALHKDAGYESDSTLVFRRHADARSDTRDTSQLYRQIQRGGEVPLEGLRKPAPRKPQEPVSGLLDFPQYLTSGANGPARKESQHKYQTSEVNIHYKTPVRVEQKEEVPPEELQRRQAEHMTRVYEQERRKKYLQEVEDLQRRRHADHYTPLQKGGTIPLNRYDDTDASRDRKVARALFNFTAQNKRELSFNKGDIIGVRRQIDKNWHEGELRGVVGIFPSNYVEITPAEQLRSPRGSEGRARARFAFQAQSGLEMSLGKGETVTLTRRVDANWYEGRAGARRGIFPVAYVEVLLEPGERKASPARSPLPRPSLPSNAVNGAVNPTFTALPSTPAPADARAALAQPLSVNTQQESTPYRALYNYKPQNEDELELREGDVVMVMEKCDDGWFVGTSRRTNLFGTFPGNYVERQ